MKRSQSPEPWKNTITNYLNNLKSREVRAGTASRHRTYIFSSPGAASLSVASSSWSSSLLISSSRAARCRFVSFSLLLFFFLLRCCSRDALVDGVACVAWYAFKFSIKHKTNLFIKYFFFVFWRPSPPPTTTPLLFFSFFSFFSLLLLLILTTLTHLSPHTTTPHHHHITINHAPPDHHHHTQQHTHLIPFSVHTHDEKKIEVPIIFLFYILIIIFLSDLINTIFYIHSLW